MSRIAALLHRQGPAVQRETLERLVVPVRHRATDGPRFWVGTRCGLAYQCLQTSATKDELQPVAGSGDIAVCFDGRLDNREELIHLLKGDLASDPTECSDASLVLACYRRFGESFASHLNGDFALAIADESQRKLVLARDVIGVRPLYFWLSAKTAIAASEIKSMLAHQEVTARPNDVALADLIVGGDVRELRLTFFQDVIRVRPGYTVVIGPERLQEFQHWDFDPGRQVRLSSFEEYAEALRALFEQAVRRRLRTSGSAVVTVSGGLDSSAVLCQAEKLRQAGVPVAPAWGVSVTFPEGSPADEKVYLDHIEEMYGVRIRRLLFSSFRFVDEEEWLWRTEYPRLRWNSELSYMEAARELKCSVILDGEYGDQMMSNYGHLYELAGSLRWLELRSQLRVLIRTMGITAPRDFLKDLLYDFIRDLAPDAAVRLIRVFRRLRGTEGVPLWFSRSLRELAYQRRYHQRRPQGRFAGKQQELCYAYFHTAHVLNPFEEINKMAASYGMEKAYPFMDRDLVRFMMAIPSEVVNRGGEFKGLFREAMRGLLPEAIRLRYWKADFTPLDTGAAATGYSRFEEYLRPDCLAIQAGYLDPRALLEVWALHQAKLTGETMFPAAQLNAVVALELWLRAFSTASRPGSGGGRPEGPGIVRAPKNISY